MNTLTPPPNPQPGGKSFLDLPPELRDLIYTQIILDPDYTLHLTPHHRRPFTYDHALLLASKTTHIELSAQLAKTWLHRPTTVTANIVALNFRPLLALFRKAKQQDPEILRAFVRRRETVHVRLFFYDEDFDPGSLGKWLGFVESEGLDVVYEVRKLDEGVREAVLGTVNCLPGAVVSEGLFGLLSAFAVWRDYGLVSAEDEGE